MNEQRRIHQIVTALALLTLASAAQASCGSAACTLMTDHYAQGAAQPHPGWSADLRVESVTQKRLRTGTTHIDASQVTDEEAIERKTSNLNLVTTLTYGMDEHWSFSLRVPVVKRDHQHDLLDENTGLPAGSEQWRFTKPGDVVVLARHQMPRSDTASYALFGGLKLPTGATNVTNGEGTRAERSLQPGSGTTDLVIGAASRQAFGLANALTGQASLSEALNSSEDFKPGTRAELSVGWAHAYSAGLGAVVQLNLHHREHDTGAQAEPDNSGSTTVDVSPGVTLAIGQGSTVYVYLQLPLYQDVRGIQLVPRNAFAAGWTVDF